MAEARIYVAGEALVTRKR